MTGEIKPCDCAGRLAYTPSAKSPVRSDAELQSIETVDAREFWANEERRFLREIAFHEAGHIVADAAVGRTVEYATVGDGGPHVRCDTADKLTSSALLIALCAGEIAGGIASGATSFAAQAAVEALRRARAGLLGRCDECRIATLLVGAQPDSPDVGLLAIWRAHAAITVDLFDRLEFRCHVHRIAAALQDRIELHRAEIEELLYPDELRTAVRGVLGGEADRVCSWGAQT